MSVKTEIIGATHDDKLAYLLEKVAEGTSTFINAIRTSPDECHEIGFKAFTLKTDNKQEADSVFDIIMTAAAIEMKAHAMDLISKFTFSTKTEEAEGEFYLLMQCRKSPPTADELAPVANPDVPVVVSVPDCSDCSGCPVCSEDANSNV